jgi:hypothetical protein
MSNVKKLKKITEIENFYIRGNIEKGLESIASDLGRPVDDIKALFETYHAEANTPKKANDMMTKNEEYGVVIMTKEASEKGQSYAKQKVEPNGPAASIHKL